MIERPTTSRFPSMIGNSSTNYLRGSMMAAAAASNSKPSPTNSTGDGGKHDSCDLGQSGYLYVCCLFIFLAIDFSSQIYLCNI